MQIFDLVARLTNKHVTWKF